MQRLGQQVNLCLRISVWLLRSRDIVGPQTVPLVFKERLHVTSDEIASFKAFHSPSKQSWFEIMIVLIVIVNGTAKEPLRCVVISFSFDFISWHSISMNFEPVGVSRVRFPAKLPRAVSVLRKQSRQVRSIGGLVWLVIKIVNGLKERVLLQWSLTLDVILIVLITKGTPLFISRLVMDKIMTRCLL